MMRNVYLCLALAGLLGAADLKPGEMKRVERGQLDPRGEIHIPIGIPDTLDSLKTFVEPDGSFSPGMASYLYDRDTRKLTAATMDGITPAYGLSPEGYLIPWSSWPAGEIGVRTDLCEVKRSLPKGEVYIAASRVRLTNNAASPRRLSLYLPVRSLGPAGWPIRAIAAAGDALLVEGHPASKGL
jgi:hypothetical protein